MTRGSIRKIFSVEKGRVHAELIRKGWIGCLLKKIKEDFQDKKSFNRSGLWFGVLFAFDFCSNAVISGSYEMTVEAGKELMEKYGDSFKPGGIP